MDEQRIAEIEARAKTILGVVDLYTKYLDGPLTLSMRHDLTQTGREDIPDLIAAWREQQQRIAELEARAQDAEQEARLMRELVKRLAAAMRYSEDVGCTDHLDACEDAGEFWYRAIDAAEAMEQRAEPEGGA